MVPEVLIPKNLLTALRCRAMIDANVWNRQDCVISMLNKLRVRNLAHPGCLIGTTLGLTVGIILGGVLASVYNVALNTILLLWLGITLVLAAIGWFTGDRLSSRFPAPEEANDLSVHTSQTSPTSPDV